MNKQVEQWIPGPLLTELPNNSTKYVRHDLGAAVGDIVVIHWEGVFTAYRNECLHQEMPIHAGTLTPNGLLICPWHNWCYDVQTGACTTVPGATLASYPVRVDSERVWVGIPTNNGS